MSDKKIKVKNKNTGKVYEISEESYDSSTHEKVESKGEGSGGGSKKKDTPAPLTVKDFKIPDDPKKVGAALTSYSEDVDNQLNQKLIRIVRNPTEANVDEYVELSRSTSAKKAEVFIEAMGMGNLDDYDSLSDDEKKEWIDSWDDPHDDETSPKIMTSTGRLTKDGILLMSAIYEADEKQGGSGGDKKRSGVASFVADLADHFGGQKAYDAVVYGDQFQKDVFKKLKKEEEKVTKAKSGITKTSSLNDLSLLEISTRVATLTKELSDLKRVATQKVATYHKVASGLSPEQRKALKRLL